MNIPRHQQPSPWRYLWLVALISLPALAWYGVLDDFSSRDINNSISNAGLIYGTARGINALVSLLQGTELNIVLVTVSIGEVLDPVNDLIERFSDVVLFALGSLALQKILLAVVSHTMFNILLSVVAAFTSLYMILGSPRVLSVLLRIFLVIAFFRFSLGLVVLANGWVDATFLNEADQQRHIAMEVFQGELRQLDSLSKDKDEATEQLPAMADELADLDRKLKDRTAIIDGLNSNIEATESRLENLAEKAGGLCSMSLLSPTCPDEVKGAKADLDLLETDLEVATLSQATIEKDIEALQEEMDCLKKRQNGKTCGSWGLPGVPDTAALRQRLSEINDNLSEFAENTINLLVSLLLKTVAIPLLFIYLLLKIARMNWSRI